MKRRTFILAGIAGLASVSTHTLRSLARTITTTAPTTPVAAATAAATTTAAALSPYGSGLRQQVFEVIVRQAIAGAPWREICQGPMEVNAITFEQVEEEIETRKKITLAHPDHSTSDNYRCQECLRHQKKNQEFFFRKKEDSST